MEKRIIEVNGVKVEVDLREAKQVNCFRVGDRIKILVKEYQSYKPYHGVIVGFDAFQKLPTITVMYLDDGYKAEMKFAYVNAESEGVEIVPADNSLPDVQKAEILRRLDVEIEKAAAVVDDLKGKRAFFLSHVDSFCPADEA